MSFFFSGNSRVLVDVAPLFPCPVVFFNIVVVDNVANEKLLMCLRLHRRIYVNSRSDLSQWRSMRLSV